MNSLLKVGNVQSFVVVARAVGAALTFACIGTPTSGQVALTSCGASSGESRWVADSYRETHTYGLGDEEWIVSYGGLAAAGDTVFLYDQLQPRIVHLSGDLVERHTFGRLGEGPGEFNGPFPITWLDDLFEGHIAFDGRYLAIYDRLDLASFDANGGFRWSARLPSRHIGDGVEFVGPLHADMMIFGMDLGSWDRSLDRSLRLGTVGRLEPHHQELLWERTVSAGIRDAPAERFVSVHKREARSQWARHQGCVVVSDGGSRFLWVVDLSTLQTDSLGLPEWEIPDFGELRSDYSVANIGGRNMPRAHPPRLLWRWKGLIVDPDGHVWLRAWTESREELEVFVVSLASGESRRLMDPPGFPTAFGPPGVLYTAREKTETGEQYVVRLQAAQR